MWQLTAVSTVSRAWQLSLFASRQCSVDSRLTVSWVSYREDRNHKGQEQLHQMSTSYDTDLKLLVSNTHTCTSIRYKSVYQNISWSMKKNELLWKQFRRARRSVTVHCSSANNSLWWSINPRLGMADLGDPGSAKPPPALYRVAQKSKLLYCDNSLLFLSHPVKIRMLFGLW